MAQEINLKIGQNEASLLVQTVGTSLRDISTQLEKLKLFAYPNDVVTVDMINEIVFNNFDIYSLVDEILQKDWARALNTISEILQKEHFLPSLAFIQTAIGNLLKIKIYSKKMSSYELAMKLNQNEFIIKKNLEKLGNVNLDDLIRIKINLSEAEFNLKTGIIKDPICAYELAFLEGYNA